MHNHENWISNNKLFYYYTKRGSNTKARTQKRILGLISSVFIVIEIIILIIKMTLFPDVLHGGC